MQIKVDSKLFKYYEMATIPSTLSIGPFGGPGGGQWDDGTYKTVRKMIIRHSSLVNSVQIEYEDQNGKSKLSEVHGGRGGSTTGNPDEVKLDYPNEFIISISGYVTGYVQSLTINTNKKQYGPYGTEQGEYFSTSSKGGKVVGFFGRSGWYLDSIGAYFAPHDLLSIGPFGGTGGQQFDDGSHTTIREIKLRHGDGFVSIQTVYDNNGVAQWSDVRGTIRGGVNDEVKLDYPDEFLISISGYLTEDSSNAVVQALIFQSNKKKYGPYGKAEGKFFSTSSTGGKITGFYGSSGEYINSIGAHF